MSDRESERKTRETRIDPKLRDAGVTLVGSSDHIVTHSLYVLDPDGNEVELYIDVPGIDWRSNPSILMAPPRPLRL